MITVIAFWWLGSDDLDSWNFSPFDEKTINSVIYCLGFSLCLLATEIIH